MIYFIIIAIAILLIVYAFKSESLKKQKNQKQKLQIKNDLNGNYINTSSNSTIQITVVEEKLFPIKLNADGYWILNSGSSFDITLLNKNKNIAQKLKELLDKNEALYLKEHSIAGLIAEFNLKIKEIEDYKAKYQSLYLAKLEEQKTNSKEWNSLGEKDKEDLLNELKVEAFDVIYERANCDLEILFENEPKDLSFDDELIKEYGFENLQLYLKYVDKLNKLKVIPSDHYYRQSFEKLVELDLAEKGTNLSKVEILSTLTLKELNSIINGKEYKRKNQAIEFILTLENIDEIISKNIALREIFKIKPLPEKYNNIDINTLANAWNYHTEEARLLLNTYFASIQTNGENSEYITGYKIIPMNNVFPCKCANDRQKKKYTKTNKPKIPCHIGCNCYMDIEYNFK